MPISTTVPRSSAGTAKYAMRSVKRKTLSSDKERSIR